MSLWADAIVPLAATLDGDLVVSYEGDPAIVQMNSNLDNAIITGGRAEIYAQLTELLDLAEPSITLKVSIFLAGIH